MAINSNININYKIEQNGNHKTFLTKPKMLKKDKIIALSTISVLTVALLSTGKILNTNLIKKRIGSFAKQNAKFNIKNTTKKIQKFLNNKKKAIEIGFKNIGKIMKEKRSKHEKLFDTIEALSDMIVCLM